MNDLGILFVPDSAKTGAFVKVFISWSGTRSKETAILLRGWLPKIVNDIQPWVSEVDLAKGGDWSGEITTQLDDADFGIICVTPGNMERPWLLFEAGALSRQVKNVTSKVAPLLIGFNSKSDLPRPLSRFQSTETTKSDMLKLVRALNAECALSISDEQLTIAFDVWWPHFDIPFREIESRTVKSPPRPRPDREVLEEILQIVRSQQQQQQIRESPGVRYLRSVEGREPSTEALLHGEPTSDARKQLYASIRESLSPFGVSIIKMDLESATYPRIIAMGAGNDPSRRSAAVDMMKRHYPSFVLLFQD